LFDLQRLGGSSAALDRLSGYGFSYLIPGLYIANGNSAENAQRLRDELGSGVVYITG
jgi:hypothetical protein